MRTTKYTFCHTVTPSCGSDSTTYPQHTHITNLSVTVTSFTQQYNKS